MLRDVQLAGLVTTEWRRNIWPVMVWDFESGRALATLESHADGVRACSVTPDGRVVLASDDDTLNVWDLESGCALATLEGHTDGRRSVERRARALGDHRKLSPGTGVRRRAQHGYRTLVQFGEIHA